MAVAAAAKLQAAKAGGQGGGVSRAPCGPASLQLAALQQQHSSSQSVRNWDVGELADAVFEHFTSLVVNRVATPHDGT